MSKEYYCPKCHNKLTYYRLNTNPGSVVLQYKYYYRCDKSQDYNYDEEIIKKLEPDLLIDFGINQIIIIVWIEIYIRKIIACVTMRCIVR